MEREFSLGIFGNDDSDSEENEIWSEEDPESEWEEEKEDPEETELEEE